MSLAKYHEEIEARWLENTSNRYERDIAELFQHIKPAVPPPGNVYLLRSGRRMEDTEVCEVGLKLELTLEASPGCATPELHFLDGPNGSSITRKQDCSALVVFSQAGCWRVQVSSGAFHKLYSIHAVEPFRKTALSDLATLINSLSENPPEWSDQAFEEFRKKLEAVLSSEGLPDIFAQGVVEYHLALFHEEKRFPSFRQRLESAYGNLRWFVPYSDMARLVCGYYLYCANEFNAATTICGRNSGGLPRAALFLQGKIQGLSSSPRMHLPIARRPQDPLTLLVALPDVLLFRAIDAFLEQAFDEALQILKEARRYMRADFDRERLARASYIEARVMLARGKSEEAASLLESLRYSPWPSITKAAESILPAIHE